MEINVITRIQFNNILRIHGFDRYYDEDAKTELFNYFVRHNFPEQMVKEIMNGAKKRAIISNDRYIKFSDVKDIILASNNSIDLAMLKKLNDIDQKFKQFYREHNLDWSKIDVLIKDCWKTAIQVSDEVNQDITEFTNESINTLYSLACIYYAISSHTSGKYATVDNQYNKSFIRLADMIMMKKVNKLTAQTLNRLSIYYPNQNYKTQAELFGEFLDELANKDADVAENEVFTSGDIAVLLNHTSSLVAFASKQKLQGARSALSLYLDSVLDLSKDKPTLKNFTTKNIFLRAGSILAISPEKLKNTVRLLLGEKISNLPDRYSKNNFNNSSYARLHILQTLFPNMKVEGMNPNKHNYILQNRNTMFITLNTNNIYDATTSIINCLYDGYGLNENIDVSLIEKKQALENLGFDLEKLYHGDNIFDIFPSKFVVPSKTINSDKMNFTSNISLLSKIVSAKNIQKIINHNFNFLTQDENIIINELQNIFKKSKNYDELKSRISDFINTAIKLKDSSTQSKSSKSKNVRSKLIKETISIDELTLNIEELIKLGFKIEDNIKSSTFIKNGKGILKSDKKYMPKPDDSTKNNELYRLIDYVESNPKKDDDELNLDNDEPEDIQIIDAENPQKEIYEKYSKLAQEISDIINSPINLSSKTPNTDDYFSIIDELTQYVNSENSSEYASARLFGKIKKLNKSIEELIKTSKSDEDLKLMIKGLADNLSQAKSGLFMIIETIDSNMVELKELVKMFLDTKKSENITTISEYDSSIEESNGIIKGLIAKKNKSDNRDERRLIDSILNRNKYNLKDLRKLRSLELKNDPENLRKKEDKQQIYLDSLTEYQKLAVAKTLLTEYISVINYAEDQIAKLSFTSRNSQKINKSESMEDQISALEQEISELKSKLESKIQLLAKKEKEFNSTYKHIEILSNGHGQRLKDRIEKLRTEIESIAEQIKFKEDDLQSLLSAFGK